jgi:hypothetical protein
VLFANGVEIGRTTADQFGNWQITSNTALADGVYTITARVLDRDTNGTVRDTETFVGNNATGNLVIDTVGPKVVGVASLSASGLVFVRNAGQLFVSFQDDRAGLATTTLIDNRNWSIRKPHKRPGRLLFTSLQLQADGGSATAPQTVLATINNNQHIRGGTYTLTLSSGAQGITDIAGNELDGEFYGYFPSGNNVRGGDFVAIIDSLHRIVFSPKPSQGYATPLNPPGTLGNALLLRNPPGNFTILDPVFTPPTPPGFTNPTFGHPGGLRMFATAKAKAKKAAALNLATKPLKAQKLRLVLPKEAAGKASQ